MTARTAPDAHRPSPIAHGVMQITDPDISRTTRPTTAMQERDSPVVVDGLHRRYGGPSGYEAVRGVSFTVDSGEIFALLGTNGAGKTSTLEVVEGLSRPTRGKVSILGLDPIADRRKVRPRIGIMLQQGGFPSDLTVTETARMWAGTLSRPRAVCEALEMVDLAQRATGGVKSLSGGASSA
ncbi:MAG: ATP-binding cassette domain-containing protein [Geodermatophilaceae bacterium]